MQVGCTSLGSFSARFTELMGETPSEYRARSHDERARHPGVCREAGRPADPQPVRIGEARGGGACLTSRAWRPPPAPAGLPGCRPPPVTAAATATLAVANCFLVVDDHEKALTFYRDVLGFTVTQDVSMGDYRWLSVSTPTQPELEITIQSVGGGPGTSEEDRAAIDTLLAKGLMSPLIFSCDDVDALFEHVQAAGTAEVLQEPADQFYGVRDCAFRDPAGNMLRFKTALPTGTEPAPPDGRPRRRRPARRL